MTDTFAIRIQTFTGLAAAIQPNQIIRDLTWFNVFNATLMPTIDIEEGKIAPSFERRKPQATFHDSLCKGI